MGGMIEKGKGKGRGWGGGGKNKPPEQKKNTNIIDGNDGCDK